MQCDELRATLLRYTHAERPPRFGEEVRDAWSKVPGAVCSHLESKGLISLKHLAHLPPAELWVSKVMNLEVGSGDEVAIVSIVDAAISMSVELYRAKGDGSCRPEQGERPPYIEVTCCTISGESHCMCIASDANLGMLRKEIARMIQIPAHKQRLECNGHLIEQTFDKSLESAGVVHGSTVTVLRVYCEEFHVCSYRSRSLRSRVPARMRLVKKSVHSPWLQFQDCLSGRRCLVRQYTDAHDDEVECVNLVKELHLYNHFSHEHIHRVIDMFPFERRVFRDVHVAVEHMVTDLHSVLHMTSQQLTEQHCQWISCQIFEALAHIHSAGVVLGNLMPENISISKTCDIKLREFSRAHACGQALPEKQYSTGPVHVHCRLYDAPERTLGHAKITGMADMWAGGCILCEMYNRKRLFGASDKSAVGHLKNIMSVCGSPADDDLRWLEERSPAKRFLQKLPVQVAQPWDSVVKSASTAAQELLASLLRFDPSKRTSALAALGMEYFRELVSDEYLKSLPTATPFDWPSFEEHLTGVHAMQDYLYSECARFNPEILVRDSE